MKPLEPQLARLDQHKPKFEYLKLPELKLSMLPSLSGFTSENKGEELFPKVERLFNECIVEAIKNPKWLLVPTLESDGSYSPEYNKRMKQGLPSAQHSTREDVKKIKILSTHPQLRAFAQRINAVENFGISHVDVMMRAHEIMAEKYPELRFYRGANFDEKKGFDGVSFSPGSPATAIWYLWSDFNSSPRAKPVLVVVKFKDVVDAYVRGKLPVYTEGKLYRDSLNLVYLHETTNVELYRISDMREKVGILKDFEARAIKL